jgi:outer membrane receptor protein involved in Fe transport
VKAAAADEDTQIDLLSETNVTAQRRKTTERENTQTTYVVGREEIKALGANTLSYALRLIPGFTLVDSLNGVDLRGQNQLRGLDDARFIILQDGRPLTRASNNRGSDISKLPTFNIERIEVVQGGGTLRYGADAIAGVINVITQTPEGPPKFSVGVSGGSFGFAQYTARYSGSNGLPSTESGYFGYDLGYERRSAINDFRFTSTVDGRGFGVGTLEADGSITPRGDTYTFSDTAIQNYTFSDFYFGKFIFKPGKDHTVTTYIQQQNTRRGSAGFATGSGLVGYNDKNALTGAAPGYGAYVYTKDYYLANYNFGNGDSAEDETGVDVTWDWNLSELNTLSTQISMKHTSAYNPTGGGQKFLNNRTLEAQVRYSAELYKGNSFNAGLQVLSNRSVQSPEIGRPSVPTEGTDPSLRLAFDREVTRYAFYATDDVQLLDKALIINYGARTTVDNQFGVYTSLGAGVRYNFGGPNPATAPFGLRFNYAESLKSPGLSQLYATFTSGRNIALPNPDLKPELGKGYDAGLDIQFSPSMVLRATYFRTDLQNAIIEGVRVDDNGTNTFSQTINAQATLSTGWEFVFDWKLDSNWRLVANETFLDARPVGDLRLDPPYQVSGRPVARGYFYGYQNADTPYNTTNLALRYTSPSLDAALSAIFVGERRIGNTSFIDSGYTRVDLTATVPVTPNISINGGIYNLLNEQYFSIPSFGYPGTPFNFRVGVDATF